MKLNLTENLTELAKKCPFPLYAVGGTVRDGLAGLCLKEGKRDYDICAPVSAEEFESVAVRSGFEISAVYKNTGTVKLKDGAEEYEFTSFRTDKYVRGEHVPRDICFTQDIELDARRRDFKCNAVYYDIAKDEICDPLGGVEDIKNGVLSTVAPSEKVFGEDGLRLMRLARFAAQTGFKPNGECVEGARKNRDLIADIKPERICSELCLILSADCKYGQSGGQYVGVKLLDGTGVLGIIIPELEECRGILQRNDFHNYDVLEHSLRAVLYADVRVRAAALLHDIGKAKTFKDSGKFTGHEEVGAAMAEEVLTRLKFPKKFIADTVKLIELHMYDLRCDARENKARKFIINNLSCFNDLLALKQADFSACKDDTGRAPFVEKYLKIYEKMEEEGVPFTLKELKINGNDLKDAGFKECAIGEILNYLLTSCVIGAVPNEKQRLLSFAEKTYRG